MERSGRRLLSALTAAPHPHALASVWREHHRGLWDTSAGEGAIGKGGRERRLCVTLQAGSD